MSFFSGVHIRTREFASRYLLLGSSRGAARNVKRSCRLMVFVSICTLVASILAEPGLLALVVAFLVAFSMLVRGFKDLLAEHDRELVIWLRFWIYIADAVEWVTAILFLVYVLHAVFGIGPAWPS